MSTKMDKIMLFLSTFKFLESGFNVKVDKINITMWTKYCIYTYLKRKIFEQKFLDHNGKKGSLALFKDSYFML